MYPKRPAASTSRGAARRAIAVAGCFAGLFVPSVAQATPVIVVEPTLSGASEVAVGDAGEGQLILRNRSTGVHAEGVLTLNALTLVPSCGQELADTECQLGNGADLGVITVDDAPENVAGSGACTGVRFSVSAADPETGQVTLTPNGAVILGLDATCVVPYTFAVNRIPTHDSSGGTPGKQTDLVGFARAVSSYNNLGQMANGIGWGTVSVVKDTPDLSIRASQTIQTGGNVSVTATLEGTDPDGSVTFNLYGPTDPACAAAPIYSNTTGVDGNGSYPSPTVQASQPGAYRWKATYSGDEDNFAVTSSCLNPAAATIVTSPPPPPPPPPPPATPPPPPAPGGGGNGGTGGTGGTGTTPGTGSQPGRGTLPGATVQKIKLDGFALTRRTFARAPKATALAATAAAVRKPARKKASPKGTTIKYKLSAPATVTIIVERVTVGRKSGTKCVKATKKLKQKKPCTRYTKVATIKRTHKTKGAKKVAFSGRAGRKALAAGSYRMRATATAGVGSTSVQRSAKFKIVKR